MTDFAARRTAMVDGYIRPSDVTKFPIIDAMLSVPREAYVPDAMRELAYIGEHMELGGGRAVMDARVLAKTLDVLDIRAGELVLDIGCAYGYTAAVIARLAEAVVAVEEDSTMAADAEATLAAEGVDNAAVIEAPLTEGAPKHGPYDVITIEGAVETVPGAILDQLKDGGRIAAIFMEGALGELRIGHKTKGRVSWRYAFNATAPLLPGFAAERSFAL